MAFIYSNDNYGCTGGTTSTVTSSSVWVTWVDSCTASATTTSDAIWSTWTTNTDSTSATSSVAYHRTQSLPTAEEIRAAEKAREAAQKKAAEEAEQRKLAAAKAQELLRANLSQKQREALDQHGWFLVEGGKSKKTYKVLGNRYAGNIHELDESGKEVVRYCVHADCTIPLGDQLLAQALCLKHDEDHIIGKANKTALAA